MCTRSTFVWDGFQKLSLIHIYRAVIVYANKVREAFGDIPLIIGGLEASLRRFAHYDYWEDKVCLLYTSRCV